MTMKNRSWLLLAFALFALILALTLGIWSHKSAQPPQARQTIVIADSKMLHSSLVYVAMDRGYFAEGGLDIRLQTHAYGRLALAAMLEGKADMATVAEVPFANAIIAGKNAKIVAGINSSDKDIVLVSRSEAGIHSVQDLSGKTVGMIPGTSSEAFLSLLLASNRVPATQVNIVPVKADAAVALLNSGKIDAFAGWLSLHVQARQTLKNRAVVLVDPSAYTESWLLTAPTCFVETHSAAIQKLLRALMRAEKFIRTQPQLAQTIVLRYIPIDEPSLREHWSDFSFTMDLNQTLVINLEYMARMLLSRQSGKAVPNFLPAIALNDMAQVDPVRVTIPH